MAYEKDPNEIGCFWIKEKNGKKFLSGLIDGRKVVVFKNNKKTDKQPDYRVLLSRPKEQSAETQTEESSF